MRASVMRSLGDFRDTIDSLARSKEGHTAEPEARAIIRRKDRRFIMKKRRLEVIGAVKDRVLV